ncbi:MAG: hypothetical protein JW772_01660 [Candidatus Diapherotrites archaeon]|nr:hypothetical protein [Candidatus Diapherotrites archaeon]
MLEEYIQSNGLNARLINSIQKRNLIKCDLFGAENDYLIIVRFAKPEPDLEKLNQALGFKKMRKITGFHAEEITGYREEYLPPISVYGIKTFVDERILQEGLVRCLVGEEKTLVISPKEILRANEFAEAKKLFSGVNL